MSDVAGASDPLDLADEINRRNAGQTLWAATPTDPDQAARAQRAAATLGLPPAAVTPDLPYAEQQVRLRQSAAALPTAPKTTGWLADPNNAAVSHDSVPALATIERWAGLALTGFNPVLGAGLSADALNQAFNRGSKPGDIPRAIGTATGSIFRGFGSAFDALNRLEEHSVGVYAPAGGPMPSDLTAPVAKPLIGLGNGLKQTLLTQGASFVPSVAAALFNPALGAVAFGSQGADTVQQDAADKGKTGTTGADLATVGNAALQGVLGLVGIRAPGLGLILPKIANPALRILTHLGVATAENAATGAVMQAGSNVIEKTTFDPNKTLAEGVGDSAGQMAVFGALFHSAHMLPGAIKEFGDAAAARAAANASIPFDAAVREATINPVAQRSPDRFDDLMSHVAGGQNVYVPADTVREFMQSKMSPEEQAKFADATGITDQLPTAIGPGADIAFPADKYLSVVSQIPGAHDAFADHLRMAPDAMSAEEARAFDEHYADFIKERGEQLATEGATVNAAMAPAHAVYSDVFSQAREAGYTIDAAQQYASLYAARYETRAARLNEGLGGDDLDARTHALILEKEDRSAARQASGEKRGPLDIALETVASPAGLDSWSEGPDGKRVYAGDRGVEAALEAGRPDIARAIAERAQKAAENDPSEEKAALAARLSEKVGGLQRPRTNAFTEYQSAGEGRGVTIKRELPPELVSRFDRLDPVIDALRKGAKAADTGGPSLLDYLSRNGGLKDEGGELSSMDADKWHTAKPFRSKLVRPDGKTLEQAAEGAQEAGYLGAGHEDHVGQQAEESDLLEAVRRELAGEKITARPVDERTADFQRAVDGLDETLGRLGIDPAKATNSEIRAAVKAYQAQHAAGRTLGQGPGVTIKGDEIAPLDADVQTVRAAARKWFNEHLKGTSVHSDALGADVTFGSSGREKAISRSGAGDKLRLFAALPDLIRSGQAVRSEPSYDPRETSVKAYHTLESSVLLGNRQLRVRVLIREAINGRFYYDHDEVAEGPAADARSDPPINGGGGTPGARSGPPNKNGGGTPGGGTSYGQDMVPASDGVNLEVAPLDQERRGSITFGDGPAIIRLFKGRDLSTLLHETGHLWAEELRADAGRPDAPEQIGADWAATAKWLGLDPGADIQTEQHEQFARGFEAYLMDGRAPSEALRSVFQKFRSWLVNIYRNIAGLNVDVSPEMKAVFDRLVATEDEISAAAKRESLNPIFLSPEDGNMSTVEWSAYTKALNGSNEAARDQLMARLMRDIRRTRTKEWRDERASVREDEAAQVDARPDVKAYHYLTRGELLGAEEQPPARKLDRQAVVMTYGTDAVLDRLPRGTTVETGGAHPDDIAALTGHTSGEAMLDRVMALEDARKNERVPPRGIRKMLIDAATNEEMISRHGDALHDGSIEEEAADALHNDERMSQVSMEVAALGKASEERPWSREILKRYAEETINDKKVGELRPDAFLRAERQAGNEAQRFLQAGDQVRALERKRQQLLNMHFYRAARDAQERVTRAQNLFDRLAKTKSLATMAQDYLDQIHALLQRYGYRVPQTNLAADFEEWKAEREAAGEPVIDTTPAIRPLKDLTVEELAGLKDTIDNLAHVGRREKELLVAGRREKLADLADEVLANFQRSKVTANIDTRGVIPANWGAQARASLMKMETIADMMDLKDGTGPFNRVLIHGSSDANARENALQHQVLDALREHYDGIPYENRRTWRRLVDHTLTDPRNNEPMKLTKANVVSMALNMGNAENWEKLTEGYGWHPQAVHDLVMKTLDAEDWKFVQGTWDTINSLWPDIVKTERALSGVAPKKVDATPVVTPHGTFAGGYYPVKYDAQRSRIARENEDRNLQGAFGHKLTGAATRTGFTKERTRFSAPISLSPERVIFGHMRDVVKRIAWAEWFLDSQRFLKNELVAKAVEHRLGTDFHDTLIKLTRTSVGYNLLDERALGWLERALRTWRVNGVTNIAGFNPKILLEHTAAHAQSIAVLGRGAWAKGVADYASDPVGKAQFVFDRSPEMVARKDQANQNIADLMADISEHRDPVVNLAEKLGVKPSAVEAIRKAPHMPISAVNLRAVALPTWLGGYHKALGEGLSERDAIRAGDKAVRVSHASGAAKDLSLVQQGNEFYRIFTTFFAYHLNQWNLYERGVEDIRQSRSAKDYARSVESMIWALPIAAIVGALVSGAGPKKDSGPAEMAEWAVDRTIRALWEGVPIARNLGDATLDIVEGKGARAAMDDATSVPAVRGLRVVATAGVDVSRMVRQALGDESAKAPSDKWLEHLIEAPGYFLGLPLMTPARSIEYLKEVHEGTQQPADALEFASGVAFGPGPKR